MDQKIILKSLKKKIKKLKLAESERKQLESALRESEARFRILYEKAPLGYQSLDENGNFIEVNQAWLEQLGYSREEVIGKSFGDFLHPDWKDHFKVNFPRFKAVGEVLGVEFEIRKKDGAFILVSFNGKISNDLNGHFRQTHCIFHDITETRRIEEEKWQAVVALHKSEARYRELVENANSIIIRLDKTGHVTFFNEYAQNFFGYPEDDILGRNVVGTIVPETDSVGRNLRDMILDIGEHPEQYAANENENMRWNGERVWIAWTNKPLLDANGNITEILCVGNDITERKQLQDAIEKRIIALTRPIGDVSDISFDDLFNMKEIQRFQDEFSKAAGVSSIITLPDGTPVTKPSGFCRLCGDIIRKTGKGLANCMKSDAKLGAMEPDAPLIYPCLSAGLWHAGTYISLGGKHIANWLIGQVRDETQSEEQMRRYAREIGADEDAAAQAFAEVPQMSRERFGNIANVLFTLARQLSDFAYQNMQQARLISELKLGEAALVQSNEMLRLSQKCAGAGVWDWDMKTGKLNWSSEFFHLFGLDPKTATASFDTWRSLVHPEDLQTAEDQILQSIQEQKALFNEYRIILPSGEIRWIHSYGDNEYDVDGNPVRMSGLCLNVTSQQEMKVALWESEERHHAILHTAMDGFWIADVQGNLLEVNKTYCLMSGYSETELLSMRIKDLEAVESPEETAVHMKNIIRRGFDRFESRHRRKDGSLMDVEVSVQFRPENGGRSIVFIRDISEKKAHENELRLQSLVLNQISDLVIITDMNGVITYVNQAEEKVMGRPKNDLIGHPVSILGEDPDQGATQNEILEKTLQNGMWRGDVTNVSSDGSRRILDCRTRLIYDVNGNAIALCGISTDVTTFKHAESLLKQSEEKYRRLFETMSQGIVYFGADGRILSANPSAQWILGHTNVELTGKTFADLHLETIDSNGSALPANDRPSMRALRTGKPVEQFIMGIMPPRRNDLIWISVSAIPLFSPGRTEPYQVYTTFEDITLKINTEKAIRQSEEKYRLLANNIPDIIYTLDDQARIVMINTPALARYGYSEQDIMGKTFLDFIHPDDREPAFLSLFNTLAERETERTGVQLRMAARDGIFYWFELNAKVHYDAHGIYLGEDGVVRDITDRKTSEANFRVFFESMSDMIIVAAPGGCILAANKAVSLALGYNKEEILRMQILDFHAPDMRPEAEENFKAMVRRERDTCPLPVIKKNGELVPVETRIWFGKWSGIDCIFLVSKDLSTEQEAQQRFERLFRNNPTLMAVSSIPDGRFVDVNEMFLNTTGYTWAEVVGKREVDIGMFPDPDRHLSLREQLKSDRHLLGAEMQVRCKDGTVRDGIFFGDIITSQGRNYTLTVMIDITERKQAEIALRESEERFKALHNASFGGIAIHDNGWILECNQGMSDMMGYSLSELIGINGLLLIAEEDRDLVMKNILAGNERPYEARGLRKTGDIFPMRLEARNIPYKGKQVRTVEFRDLSEIKKADEERENLQSQLIQAQKMESIGRLAGGVAHDFNNMIGVILANTEVAMDEIAPEDSLFNLIQDIKSAAERSADLTRQLLAFARKQTISPTVINLNETVQEMLKMLGRLIGEQIHLKWLPGDTLWAIKIDPSQIDQILANLCVNARDAIESHGTITIETGNVTIPADYCVDHPEFLQGEFVLLTLSDNGSGMDAETLTNIFEPFFTTKEIGKGTGLGLSTVYGIVKQNNGFINVYSEPGQGTAFKIYLPRYTQKFTAQKETEVMETDVHVHETILLVEDEPMFLDIIQRALEKVGFTVVAAGTPGEAIRLASEHPGKIHLLMTDIMMPEMNGRDLAKNIMSLYPDMKRLFMSGYTADVIAHKGVLEEGVQFIQKPFSIRDLRAKIREALEK